MSSLNDSVRDVVRGQEANFIQIKSLLGARGSQSSTPDGTPRLPVKQTQEPPKLVSALDHTLVDSDSNASVSPKTYETLVITKAQHQNFVESMQIQSTPTLTKVRQEGKKDMKLSEWWDKMFCLKKGLAGWPRSAVKIGANEEQSDALTDRASILELLIEFLDKDLKVPQQTKV